MDKITPLLFPSAFTVADSLVELLYICQSSSSVLGDVSGVLEGAFSTCV